MTSQQLKKVKRTSVGRLSKKAVWRKLEQEAPKQLTLNVRDSLIQRYIQEGIQQRSVKNALETKNGGLNLFCFDSEGGVPSTRRVQKYIKTVQKHPIQLSQSHRDGVLRVQKALAAREKTARWQQHRRDTTEQVYDIWSSSKENLDKKKNHLNPVSMLPEIPASVVAQPGESINPDQTEYRNAVLSAAASILEKERIEEEFQRKLAPISSDLADFLPDHVVENLTFLEKQKIYHYASSIRDCDPHKWNKVLKFISDELPHQIKKTLNENDDGNEDDDQDDQVAALKIHRVVHKQKSHSARSRFKRHCQRLQEAAKRREEKVFRHSINFVKQYLQELKQESEKAKVLHTYKKSLKAAYKAARLGNFRIRYKCGKYFFVDNARDILLPTTVSMQRGSLRELRLSEIPGAVIKDRMNSIYRRKLIEPLHANGFTYRAMCRSRRALHWKNKSRKFFVKIN